MVATDHVTCGACNALNNAAHTFCGVCRAELVATLQQDGTAKARRRYRDRPRVLVVSGGVFLVAALTAVGAFLVLQIGGWSGLVTAPIESAIGLGGGDPPWFVGGVFIAAFTVAGLSLCVFAVAALKLGWRAARTADYAEHRRAAAEAAAAGRRAAADAAETTRRGALAARDRGLQEYADAARWLEKRRRGDA